MVDERRSARRLGNAAARRGRRHRFGRDDAVAACCRRPTRAGVPQLSPTGDRLLFTSTTRRRARPRSGCRQRRDGSDAKSVDAGLGSGLAAGTARSSSTASTASHAAVFSLPTMTLRAAAGSGPGRSSDDQRQGGEPDAQTRSRCLLVDENGPSGPWRSTKVRALESRTTFVLPAGSQHLQFDAADDERLLVVAIPRRRSTLAALDWRTGTLRTGRPVSRASSSSTRHSVERRPSLLGAPAMRRTCGSTQDGAKRQLTHDGENFSAAISPNGDLLLGKRGRTTARCAIWRQSSRRRASRQLTERPESTSAPDFSPDGQPLGLRRLPATRASCSARHATTRAGRSRRRDAADVAAFLAGRREARLRHAGGRAAADRRFRSTDGDAHGRSAHALAMSAGLVVANARSGASRDRRTATPGSNGCRDGRRPDDG